MTKAELTKLVAEQAAILESLKGRFYTTQYPRQRCIAVPLSRPEIDAVADTLPDMISDQHGNHRELDENGNCELVMECELFPQFVGVVVHYHHSQQDGTYWDRSQLWGLLAVK